MIARIPGSFVLILGLQFWMAQAGDAGETGDAVAGANSGMAIVSEAADVDRFLEVPFELVSVPEKAEFDLAFRVKTTGICPGTLYEPTRIWVNGKAVASLNFRDRYSEGELVRYKFEAPVKKLRLGENTLKIRMGSCKKGADTIVLNGIKLVQAPDSSQQAAVDDR